MSNLKKIFLTIFLFCGFTLLGYAARVDTVSIYSAAMNKSSQCVIILPDSYDAQNGERLPVVYLLHGYSGNYSNWISKVPSLKEEADQYNIIIVCPDGAYSSWYFDSPVDKSSRYKTYVGSEVPAYIDSAYHTIAERKARAIAGLSMGGHGAIYLAWSFPQTFGAAGSMSGAVDLVPHKSKYGLPKVLGDTALNDLYEHFSMVNFVENSMSILPALIVDCGLSDPFINDNRLLHQRLIERNIPHDYIERPGKHNWAYWENSVSFQLLFFHHFFDKK